MISPSELSQFIADTYARADQGLQQPPQRVIVPKKYLATFPTVAPAGTSTQTIQIGANGDFFLTRMSYIAWAAVTTQTVSTGVIALFNVQITDSGSDEQFFSAPMDLSNIANHGFSGPEYRDEPYPRVITGRSTLTLVATSQESANTYSVELILHGVLVKTY